MMIDTRTKQDKVRIEKLSTIYKKLLNEWEIEFITSLQLQTFITQHQKNRLYNIEDKYRVKMREYDLNILQKSSPIEWQMELLRDMDDKDLPYRMKMVLKAWDKRNITKGFKLIYKMLYNDESYSKLHPSQKRRLYKLTHYKALKTSADKKFNDECELIKNNLTLPKRGIINEGWMVVYQLFECEGLSEVDEDYITSLMEWEHKTPYLSKYRINKLIEIISKYETNSTR